ncbi:flagellar basal body FlgE domain-containing protein [Candidatus Odyssella thessalonicensis]|uniref:flagellar basal body FlgE domain-containing protein n=1 Tax=Candidatus Odyssella thessalonicensis TaxID=84647 RepID=UPI000225C091|nr:flagellar basal body FlgE domain-containing protein [Candidatus Odyssella thessalonicensis]
MLSKLKVDKNFSKVILLGGLINAAGLNLAVKSMEATAGIGTYTGIETHTAIKGSEYFLVSDTPEENGKKLAWSPVGTWEEDNKGFFRNHLGQYLNVIYLNEENPSLLNKTSLGNLLQVASSTRLSDGAQPTTNIYVKGILPQAAPIGTEHTTQVSVVDSLGIRHPLKITYTCTAIMPRQWTVSIASSGEACVVPPYDLGVKLEFDRSGLLSCINEIKNFPAPTLIICWDNDAKASEIYINFGLIGGDDGLRCVTKEVELPLPEVDGREAKIYEGTTIDENGYMWARFKNSPQQKYAQIPLIARTNKGKFIINPWRTLFEN